MKKGKQNSYKGETFKEIKVNGTVYQYKLIKNILTISELEVRPKYNQRLGWKNIDWYWSKPNAKKIRASIEQYFSLTYNQYKGKR